MLSKVLRESFNVEENQYSDESLLMNFKEWDSMAHMFFITKLEEMYGIEITGDEIADMKSIGDVKQVILKRGLNI
jgi:acyl carrier protein